MITPAQKTKIEEIRRAVAEMIIWRDSHAIPTIFQPNEMWRMIHGYLDYIRTLSPEHLENIRAHVGMGFFIGPPWHAEFYDAARTANDQEAERLPQVQKYIAYTAGLPERFWASEPASSDAIAAIGIPYKGRRISADVVKEQATIRNLFNLGLFDESDTSPILEIGPGYGQLIYQLSTMLNPKRCFVCIDDPEMLFWTGVFLVVNADPSSLYIWQTGETTPLAELYRRHRFVLLPNYALETLGEERIFGLAINKNSFQEMSEAQVSAYAEVTAKALKGWFYSYNATRTFMNKELARPVQEVLDKHFVGGPNDAEYSKAGVTFDDVDAKRIFFGSSRSNPSPLTRASGSDSLWLAGKEVRLKWA